MDSELSLNNIIDAIQKESRVIAYIALVANVALLATIPILPAQHRIYGFVVFGVLLIGTLSGAVVVALRSLAQDHNHPNLGARVRKLKHQLFEDGFFPHLIVGIPRGGLVVAGLLAKQLGETKIVPVISLCRSGPRDFSNSLNHISFSRDDFDLDASKVNILVVDDISRSGDTLANAKQYLEASVDPDDFVVKTAALSFYPTSRAVGPEFFVDRPKKSIRDVAGEIEPMLD